jgi:hypothetical protein
VLDALKTMLRIQMRQNTQMTEIAADVCALKLTINTFLTVEQRDAFRTLVAEERRKSRLLFDQEQALLQQELGVLAKKKPN